MHAETHLHSFYSLSFSLVQIVIVSADIAGYYVVLDFLTLFADSLSLCSISKACFSDNYNARAEESNHVRSVSSRRTLRLSHVE